MPLTSDATTAAGFPRILFVHDYRPDSQVIADLLRQLFFGYPPEKLAWWSCRRTPLHEPPDLRAGHLHEFVIPEKFVPNVRLSRLKAALLENVWVPRAARHLERVIEQEKPDIVAALLYGWSVPVLARVRRPAGQRLHVSVWDFPDIVSGRKTLGENRARRFVEAIHQLVRRADSFDGISLGVLDELRLKTGRGDGVIVHSGFDAHHLEALETPVAAPADDTLRIAYVGTIISEKGFLEMMAALKRVRAALAKKVVFEFFGGRNYRSRPWFEPEWMAEHGLYTDEGLGDALRRCDWGIVVMDPEGEDLRYSRFSFPNKVGSYLSAGVPLLGFGNPQSSLARIMQEHRLGLFTSATDRGELEKFLLESLRLPVPRESFHADLLQCARTEFNVAEMRARLWRLWGVR
jgi:glycosyltransferase involved in cell wall biosynthesis